MALKQHSDFDSAIELTAKQVVDCFFCVHKELGAGFLESVYEEALIKELSLRGLSTQSQVQIKVLYKNEYLETKQRLDIVVNDQIIIEVKAVSQILPIHEAQIQSYLKSTNLQLGFLVNFNTLLIKDGIKRIVRTR